MTTTEQIEAVAQEIAELDAQLRLNQLHTELKNKKAKVAELSEPSFREQFQSEVKAAFDGIDWSGIVKRVETLPPDVSKYEGRPVQDTYMPIYFDKLDELKINLDLRQAYIEAMASAYKRHVLKLVNESGLAGDVVLVQTSVQVDINWIAEKVSWLINAFNANVVCKAKPIIVNAGPKARGGEVGDQE